MKKLVLLLIFCFMATGWACAQSNTQANADSVAYQMQRKKINNMLAARKLKFGQYSQSLSEHTGIFGLQTKDDIRRSNSILMDIVKTDDNIYKELKILLEYRDFETRQIKTHSQEVESVTTGFMATINKLRQQNAQLKADAEKAHQDNSKPIYIVIMVLMLASILYLLFKKPRLKV